MVSKVSKVPLEIKASKELLVLMVNKAFRVQQDSKVIEDSKEVQEQMVSKDSKVLQE